MKVLRILPPLALLASGVLIGFRYGRRSAQTGGGNEGKTGPRILYYVDPMHPGYKSDQPGIAPDCGMKLVPVYEGAEPAAVERKVLYYRDPADPSYTSDKPGINPRTGNDLEPVYAEGPSAAPPGAIQVSPEKQQLIGVRYGLAEYSGGVHEFRAVGRVSYDETRISRVHARIEGWVDRVYVDFVGRQVEKGEKLLTIYSPELVASQHEYLLALRADRLLKGSPAEATRGYGDSLLRAARRRLELFELSEEQIAQVARTGEPLTYVTLEAPVSGYVTTRNAFPKQRITPETELYQVADLSRVWILADVFEYEMPLVRIGQAATVSVSYLPGRKFGARVDYIQPDVDPQSRTLKVRLNAANPGMLLKPDMYVDVEFRVATPPRLSVPAEAVLDSGLRKTVFVDRGNGYLEPRQVETGERFGDRIEILRGLRAGERIVTSGNFLIDSESQLQGAALAMTSRETDRPAGPSQGASRPAPSGHQGHGR